MVFSFFLMVRNNISIMAHYDAANKGEETISSSYGVVWYVVAVHARLFGWNSE